MEYLMTHWIFALGFTAQSLFGMRILVQWWKAEGSKNAVSPSVFWNLSLAGSALFLIYGLLRHDIVIILGQLISYFIYVRNLHLKGDWHKFPTAMQIGVFLIPIVAIGVVVAMPREEISAPLFPQNNSIFFISGITGQLLLNIRFIYQLYHSERSRESMLPGGFWWMSLCGSIFLIAYAIYRRDPVLIVAQGMAIIPYARNIMLIKDRH